MRWSEPGLAFGLCLGVLALLRSELRSLSLIVRCDMKSHSPLLSVGNLTKPCLSRQVFQGSRRWTGGGNATVQGLKPS